MGDGHALQRIGISIAWPQVSWGAVRQSTAHFQRRQFSAHGAAGLSFGMTRFAHLPALKLRFLPGLDHDLPSCVRVNGNPDSLGNLATKPAVARGDTVAATRRCAPMEMCTDARLAFLFFSRYGLRCRVTGTKMTMVTTIVI